MRSQRTLTYEQWTALYKRALKRTIKQKVIQALQMLVLTVLMFMPVWMLMDWLLRGY